MVVSLLTLAGSLDRQVTANIYELDSYGRIIAESLLKPFAFQFFPDTINDEKNTGWSKRHVPGLSHPLYQWIKGGERVISFKSVFYREENGIPTNLINPARAKSISDKYNSDVAGAIAYLRRLQYPVGVSSTGIYEAPRILLLEFPRSYIAGDSSFVECVLTNVAAQWKGSFPDGTPKMAVVDLTFEEVIQDGNRIRPHTQQRYRSPDAVPPGGAPLHTVIPINV